METNSPGSDETSSADEARGALADIAAVREATAARVITPPWYHPLYAGAASLIPIGIGLMMSPWAAAWAGPLGLALLLASTLGVLIIAKKYQTLTGIWIGAEQVGPRGQRAMRYIIAALVIGVLLALTPVLGAPWWISLIGAAVVLVGLLVCGPRYDDALRDDIRAGDTAP